jgi:hypothetical protein
MLIGGPDYSCSLDGMSFDCSLASILIGSGAAAPCPDNNCGPRFKVNRDGPGRSGWEGLPLSPAGFFYNPLGPSTVPPGARPPTLRKATPGSRNGGSPNQIDEGHDHVNDFIIPIGFVLQQNPVPLPAELTPLEHLKLRLAFSDAATALLNDKKCRDFFTKGRSLAEVQSLLTTLGENAQYDPKPTSVPGTTGKGSEAVIRVRPPFFANDDTGYGPQVGYHWAPARNRYEELFTSLAPSQYWALTILHEFAHALSLISDDRRSADPTGEQSTKNDSIIDEKCGKGLERLPVR